MGYYRDRFGRSYYVSAWCTFQFQERGQQFIRAHDKAPAVVAVRVHNKQLARLRVGRRRHPQRPARRAQFVSDDLPILAMAHFACSTENIPMLLTTTMWPLVAGRWVRYSHFLG